MLNLCTLLYYVCFASSVLIYGIGLTRVTNFDFFTKENRRIEYIMKIFFSIMLSSVFSFIFIDEILVPIKLAELYPLVCLIIYILVNLILELIIRTTTGKSSTEFIFSFLVVLLSISESSSLINTIIICFSCILSLFLLVPIFYSFKKYNLDNIEDKRKYLARIFIFVAVLISLISLWDIMWINPEVIR